MSDDAQWRLPFAGGLLQSRSEDEILGRSVGQQRRRKDPCYKTTAEGAAYLRSLFRNGERGKLDGA